MRSSGTLANNAARIALAALVLAVTAPPAADGSAADVALAKAKKAVHDHPDSVEALCALSEAYRLRYVEGGASDTRTILLALKKALDAGKLDASSPRPHIALAQALLAKGDTEQAAAAAQRALALDDDNAAALKVLAAVGASPPAPSPPAPVKPTPKPPAASPPPRPPPSVASTKKPPATKPAPAPTEPSATFTDVRIEQNVRSGSWLGIRILSTAVVDRMKGQEVTFAAFFSFPSGKNLVDFDGRYKWGGDRVAVKKTLTPRFDSARWKDLSLFMPYPQMHMAPGKGTLQVQLFALKELPDKYVPVGQSEKVSFTHQFEGLQVLFKNPRIEHHQTHKGKPALVVHAEATANRLKGRKLQVVAYFRRKDGAYLKDADGAYKSPGGQVAASKNLDVHYDKAKWKDVAIPLPYEQLHLGSGAHDVECRLVAWDTARKPTVKIGESDWLGFRISR